MDEWKSYREASKIDWGSKAHDCYDQIKLGSLLRIADATELMAKNYRQLIEERDQYKKRYEESLEGGNHLRLRIAALQGVVTKMKRQK